VDDDHWSFGGSSQNDEKENGEWRKGLQQWSLHKFYGASLVHCHSIRIDCFPSASEFFLKRTQAHAIDSTQLTMGSCSHNKKQRSRCRPKPLHLFLEKCPPMKNNETKVHLKWPSAQFNKAQQQLQNQQTRCLDQTSNTGQQNPLVREFLMWEFLWEFLWGSLPIQWGLPQQGLLSVPQMRQTSLRCNLQSS
jgi:hypothetical protein